MKLLYVIFFVPIEVYAVFTLLPVARSGEEPTPKSQPPDVADDKVTCSPVQNTSVACMTGCAGRLKVLSFVTKAAPLDTKTAMD